MFVLSLRKASMHEIMAKWRNTLIDFISSCNNVCFHTATLNIANCQANHSVISTPTSDGIKATSVFTKQRTTSCVAGKARLVLACICNHPAITVNVALLVQLIETLWMCHSCLVAPNRFALKMMWSAYSCVTNSAFFVTRNTILFIGVYAWWTFPVTRIRKIA